MKSIATRKYFITGNCSAWVIMLLFTNLTASAQPTKRLKPSVYENFIRSNEVVKIQTIEGGRVKDTTNAAINNFLLPANKKQVISYDKNILAIDNASYQKLKEASQLTVPADEVKIIPELHVEPGANNTEEIAYRILFTLEQPLQYNDTLKKFNGRLGFLLVSESGSNDPPAQPVSIEVLSNVVSSIKPESFKIDHVSIPSAWVDLATERVNDSAAVKVITASNPNGYITYLKVTPSLVISTNQTKLQGLGIEQIPVNVMFVGSSSADSVKVNFSTQKGTVTPNSVYVKYNSPSTVYLRSDGIGSSKLSATSTIANSNELQFTYAFPWLFLLAAIAGGLAGSLAKYFFGAGEKQSWVKPVIGGILIGIIGATAYYGLGVNLLGINLSAGLNALAVFALSALCAYFGISMIKLDGKQ